MNKINFNIISIDYRNRKKKRMLFEAFRQFNIGNFVLYNDKQTQSAH